MNATKEVILGSHIKYWIWDFESKINGIGGHDVKRKICIVCLQETRWTGEKAKMLIESGYKLWYSGKDRENSGEGIIMVETLKDR